LLIVRVVWVFICSDASYKLDESGRLGDSVTEISSAGMS